MVFNLSAAALQAFRDQFTALLYKKVFPEDSQDMDIYVQARGDLSNFVPQAYVLQRNADNRLVLVRKALCFGTEWRYRNGPPTPKKANNWQMSQERRRILQKAKETKRRLNFEQMPAAPKVPTKLTFAPKKNLQKSAAKRGVAMRQTWSLRKQVLQKCFNSKRELKFNQAEVQPEDTPRKRNHATMMENSKAVKGDLKVKRRLINM